MLITLHTIINVPMMTIIIIAIFVVIYHYYNLHRSLKVRRAGPDCSPLPKEVAVARKALVRSISRSTTKTNAVL